MFRRIQLLCCLVLFCATGVVHAAMPLSLWYNAPAKDWEKEALPIGNGRIGAMIMGVSGRISSSLTTRHSGREVLPCAVPIRILAMCG